KAKASIQPKTSQSGRVSLEEKRQRLKQWLTWVDLHKQQINKEPSKRSFELKNGWKSHTISRLLESKESLLGVCPASAQSMSRIIKRPYYALEVILIEVVKDVRSRGLPIDSILLRALAHDTYTVLFNRMGGMPFSRPEFGKSWVELFKDAWGLHYFKMNGEAGSVDLQAIEKDIQRLMAEKYLEFWVVER
ncbi:hypothetical protein EC968_010022, partial [Mortierella alpina]